MVPTYFHVPVRAIGYYCYGHFCYESGLTGATIGSYARVSMLPDYYVAGSTLHTCITMYVGRRRSARSYCVRAHAPGLEQTDDYHRRRTDWPLMVPKMGGAAAKGCRHRGRPTRDGCGEILENQKA